MQLNLADLLVEEHIVVGLDARDAADAIRILSSVLVSTGHVKEDYAKDVIQREKTFPTGLPTDPFAVAIPHADPDHVNKSAIAIGILDGTVGFNQMGMHSEQLLDVAIIFLLAINEREKQAEMLAQLVASIQAPGILEQLKNAANEQQAALAFQSAY